MITDYESWKSKFSNLTDDENKMIDKARGNGFAEYSAEADGKAMLELVNAFNAPDAPRKYKRFIFINSGIYGHFGYGSTLDEAKANYKKAGGKLTDNKKKLKVGYWEFVSDLPFAPAGRDATEQEADSWIGQDGSINWIRCERKPKTDI